MMLRMLKHSFCKLLFLRWSVSPENLKLFGCQIQHCYEILLGTNNNKQSLINILQIRAAIHNCLQYKIMLIDTMLPFS